MSMLDNLREEASTSPFFEEEEEDLLGTEVPEQKRDWFAWLDLSACSLPRNGLSFPP